MSFGNLGPTMSGVVKVPRGEYLFPWDFDEFVFSCAKREQCVRAWRHRRRFTSLVSGSGKTGFRYKRLWTDARELEDFATSCAEAGYYQGETGGSFPMPSSFAWPWTERTVPPRTNPTTLARIHGTHNGWRDAGWSRRPSEPKAWQEAVRKGQLSGRYWIYDLNSAYAWAAYQPMPDPRAAVYTREVTGRPFGLYLLRSVQWNAPVVPRRLRSDRGHWVTKEELHQYDASRVVVEIGIEWERSIDLRAPIDTIRDKFPERFSKKILRAFWGAWSSDRDVEQWVIGKGNVAPVKRRADPWPRLYSPVWAWHVLSRVALRCADAGGADVAHVFTDSVMVSRKMGTGTELGDWKLVAEVDDPWIKAAGVWGVGGQCIKHAGKKGGGIGLGGIPLGGPPPIVATPTCEGTATTAGDGEDGCSPNEPVSEGTEDPFFASTDADSDLITPL